MMKTVNVSDCEIKVTVDTIISEVTFLTDAISGDLSYYKNPKKRYESDETIYNRINDNLFAISTLVNVLGKFIDNE